jgi:PST family polysaccharide transporter
LNAPVKPNLPHLVQSLKWSFLAELATKALTPVIFLILARLLTPEDFGVMSAAAMVIAFSEIFWEAGMGKALIQRQTDITQAAQVAFWINLGLGILIAAILFLGARWIALSLFQDERVTLVLKVMTLQLVLGALSSVPTALLQKEMEFNKLFWVRLTTLGIPGMASIPLALAGMGYWALVAGTLAGQAAQVILLWRLSQWRPAWGFQSAVAWEMTGFGVWVGISGLLGWFYLWADALIVARYLGTHDLGLYRTGNQLAMMIFGILLAPVLPVLYSRFSRLGRDRERLRATMILVIKVVILISVPMACLLFVIGTEVATLLFSSRWEGIGGVITILSLVHGFAWVVGMNGEAYRAMGHPQVETLAMAGTVLFYLGGYLYAVGLGLEAFLWARFLLMCLGLMIQLIVLKIFLRIDILPLLARFLALALATLALASLAKYHLFASSLDSPLRSLSYTASFTLTCLAGGIYLLERNRLIKELFTLFRGRGRIAEQV